MVVQPMEYVAQILWQSISICYTDQVRTVAEHPYPLGVFLEMAPFLDLGFHSKTMLFLFFAPVVGDGRLNDKSTWMARCI